MHSVLARQLRKVGIGEAPPTAEQWARLLEHLDRSYTEADQDRYTLERALSLSSEEMRTRFTALREAQEEVVRTSRRAGMADVATAVLHNVGNVLNSVNVSAGLALDVTRSSAGIRLGKALTLLAEQPKPGRFLDEDPRGKKVLDYLGAIDRALGEERASLVRELEGLARHIDHIKAVVTRQLTSARAERTGVEVVDKVELGKLVDDAIDVLRTGIPAGHRLVIAPDYEHVVVETDRHKLFELVLNLLTNARDAVLASPTGRVVSVSVRRGQSGEILLEVRDDGVGMAPDVLAKAFEQGFTTKANGFGLGLHSAACAAIELGGRLEAASEGAGLGACFTLGLPRKRSDESTP